MSKSPTPSELLKKLKDYTSRALDTAAKPFKHILRLYTGSLIKNYETFVIGSGIAPSLDKYLTASSRAMLVASATLFALTLAVCLRVLPLLISAVASAIVALVIAPAASGALLVYLPVAVHRNRGELLESKALQLLSALALLTASGQSIYRVFEALPRVLGKDFKVFSVELDMATSLLRIGVPVNEALKRVASITPSPTLRDLFISLSSIASIGGGVAQVVWSLVDRYVTRYSIRVERSVEALNMFMEVYVAVALLIPILVGSTAALLIIYPLAGISFEALMVLTTLILVPVSSAAIVVLADVIVSRVRP